MKRPSRKDDVYIENGYEDRDDYLDCLADEYAVDPEAVDILSEILGEDEDFDGLVSTLDDFDFAGMLDDYKLTEEMV
jgi:hypothetical protein